MDIITLHDVVKTYRIGVGRARIREALPPPLDRGVARLFPKWWNKSTFNALEHASLSIPAGSSVGIVGHNGAGKTTLLKVIVGVTAPTSGSVRVTGRTAALLDVVGFGFHQDLTGRENAFLLGAVQGYGRKAMASKVDRVLEFAGLGEMADTPLKRFSAGMISRLAFATLTVLDIDILLIDEVLAVGDASFQRKCMQWLQGYRARGGTLLFVSHNLAVVRNMTERVIWLDHGKVLADGPTEEVLERYGRAMERRGGEDPRFRRGEVRKYVKSRGMHRWGSGGARVEEVHVGEPEANGSGIHLRITYEAPDLPEAVIAVGFIDESGAEVAATRSPVLPVEGGQGAVGCTIDPIPFRPGLYFPVVAILSPDGRVRDRWRLDRAILVDHRERGLADDFGPVGIPSDWAMEGSQRGSDG